MSVFGDQILLFGIHFFCLFRRKANGKGNNSVWLRPRVLTFLSNLLSASVAAFLRLATAAALSGFNLPASRCQAFHGAAALINHC